MWSRYEDLGALQPGYKDAAPPPGAGRSPGASQKHRTPDLSPARRTPTPIPICMLTRCPDDSYSLSGVRSTDLDQWFQIAH